MWSINFACLDIVKTLTYIAKQLKRVHKSDWTLSTTYYPESVMSLAFVALDRKGAPSPLIWLPVSCRLRAADHKHILESDCHGSRATTGTWMWCFSTMGHLHTLKKIPFGQRTCAYHSFTNHTFWVQVQGLQCLPPKHWCPQAICQPALGCRAFCSCLEAIIVGKGTGKSMTSRAITS